MSVRPSPWVRGVTRRLLIALMACPVVFVSTLLYATLTDYPSSMWTFVMAGLFLPPVVAVMTIIMLVDRARAARAAG